MDYRRFRRDRSAEPDRDRTQPGALARLSPVLLGSGRAASTARRSTSSARHSPGRDITHNFMGSSPSSIITPWAQISMSRPGTATRSGFLEQFWLLSAEKQRLFARQGDPDFAAFHHDLYRGRRPGPLVGDGTAARPGELGALQPRAAARHGPALDAGRPLPMAPRRCAISAGGRRRLRRNRCTRGCCGPTAPAAPALAEARQVAARTGRRAGVAPVQAPVALIFDYAADWAWKVQPHGRGLSYFCAGVRPLQGAAAGRVCRWISCRSTTRDFTGYRAIFAPGLMHMPDALKAALGRMRQPRW